MDGEDDDAKAKWAKRIVKEGHPRYELVYDMLNGIRTTVSQESARALNSIKNEDFRKTTKLSFKRARDASGLCPAVDSGRYDFKFKDYCPKVFRHLRELFFIDAADYLISLTSENILMEMHTNSKSGSFFFYSSDMRFIIKTLTPAESKFLITILPFYGLHRVKGYKGKKTHFVIMGNLFPPNAGIKEKYDLKGSWVGRYTSIDEKVGGAVMKDNDFNKTIRLGEEKASALMKQISSDTAFLQYLKVMDYSLLLGIALPGDKVHNPTLFSSNADDELPRPERLYKAYLSSGASANDAKKNKKLEFKKVDETYTLPLGPHKEQMSSVFCKDNGGYRSSMPNGEPDPSNEVYYMAIIDILQPYTTRKKLEHSLKSIKYDPHGISAVDPREYAQRFRSFIGGICNVSNVVFGPDILYSEEADLSTPHSMFTDSSADSSSSSRSYGDESSYATAPTPTLVRRDAGELGGIDVGDVSSDEDSGDDEMPEPTPTKIDKGKGKKK